LFQSSIGTPRFTNATNAAKFSQTSVLVRFSHYLCQSSNDTCGTRRKFTAHSTAYLAFWSLCWSFIVVFLRSSQTPPIRVAVLCHEPVLLAQLGTLECCCQLVSDRGMGRDITCYELYPSN
jgi:hypothetical protein